MHDTFTNIFAAICFDLSALIKGSLLFFLIHVEVFFVLTDLHIIARLKIKRLQSFMLQLLTSLNKINKIGGILVLKSAKS